MRFRNIELYRYNFTIMEHGCSTSLRELNSCYSARISFELIDPPLLYPNEISYVVKFIRIRLNLILFSIATLRIYTI